MFRDLALILRRHVRGEQTPEATRDALVGSRSGTVNPQRICNLIALANAFGPMLGMFITGFVWVPIPPPAFCTPAHVPGPRHLGRPTRRPVGLTPRQD
jgi:hypothetical protein